MKDLLDMILSGKGKGIIAGLGLLAVIALVFNSFEVIQPGHRGIAVTFGTVSPKIINEGLTFKLPQTNIIQVEVRQKTVEYTSLVFSKDQQELKIS